MKHPLWIINGTLLVFVLLSCVFILFSRVSIPERKEIEPVLYTKIKKKKELDINTAKIYEADLFGTYRPTASPSEQKGENLFPEPPQPHAVEIPELPKPRFLEPLDITLRGIFAISTDSGKNRALITDNKLKKESNYKVGDTVGGDAQLIRIFGNKVVLLRSNGQQEVLYLREQDAKLDTTYTTAHTWETVIKQLSASAFMVDPDSFAERVQDLAQFIDMLRLITAFKQGKSIGCRIGKLDEKSVGIALGLQTGDIITSIDGIPADTMDNRLKIYKEITSKKMADSVMVNIVRNKQELSLEYLLKELTPDRNAQPPSSFELERIAEEEKVKILKENQQFAPTLQDIRKRERQNMRDRGTAPMNIGDGKP
jgi:type II secretory pathway component PulC